MIAPQLTFPSVFIQKQPSTRQHDKKQTTSRPGLDFNIKKRHNSLNVPAQRYKQKYENLISDLHNSPEIYRGKQCQDAQKGVKFNENIDDSVKKSVLSPQRPEISNPQGPKSFHPNYSRYEYPNRDCDNSSTDSDTEADGAESLYDNDNFEGDLSESVWEGDEDIDESIQGLQKGLNRITNKYVHNVKSQVEVAMSKLKLHETRKAHLPEPKADQVGAGDIKAPQTDELYKKMELMKKECYKKIEANLNMLKNIDSLTDEMHNNLLNHRKTFK